jgi:hypothetical protein
MLHQSPTLSSARAAGHLKLAKLVRCIMQVTTEVTCMMQVTCRGLSRLKIRVSRNTGCKNARCNKDRIAGRAAIKQPDIG